MKRYPFGLYILDIPDDHNIGDIHAIDHLYDKALSFFYKAIGEHMPHGLMVDIGANIGDTAAMILSTCAQNPVLCLEGSQEFLPYMRANLRHLGSRVTLIDRYLRPGVTSGLSLHAVHERGTGYLSNEAFNGDTLESSSFIELDEFLSIARGISSEIALIKSDTDGFDGYIIGEMIKEVNCPLFFECAPDLVLSDMESPWPSVFRELDDMEYSVIVYDNHGLPMVASQSNVEQLLTDLTGYVALQHAVQPVRVHYLDVWAFPPAWKETFTSLVNTLRNDLLRPYGF